MMARTRALWWALWTLLVSAMGLAFVFPVPLEGGEGRMSLPGPDVLRRELDVQERARAMARELLSSVLDVQLKQLRENGLERLDVYREIASMRERIAELVDRDMREVVGLLSTALDSAAVERAELFTRARGRIRDVVVHLSLERQNLLRRLKSAELAAQVRRVIELQSAALRRTRDLAAGGGLEAEALALDVAEDQKDVRALFLRLVENLADVGRWGGDLAVTAREALELARAGRVGVDLEAAQRTLDAARFPEAADHQQNVLFGLRRLLERLEEAQGLLGADRAVTLERVREIMERQDGLRARTEAADLRSPQSEPLVEEQTAIHRDLGALAEPLGGLPAALPALEGARSAAYEAVGRLFDGRSSEAIERQREVVARLAEVEGRLLEAMEREDARSSADDLERRARALERARDELRDLHGEHTSAAPRPVPDALRAERDIERRIGNLVLREDLPRLVVSRSEEAREAVRRTAAELARAEVSERRAAAAVPAGFRDAAERIEAALAEANTALADARRQALGVRAGELGRAAEALERAAAAARGLAARIARAVSGDGLDPEEARALAREEAVISRVGAKVAEGVRGPAPEAVDLLGRAGEPLESLARELRGLADGSRRARSEDLEASREHSREAARLLEKAASAVRAATAGTARALVAESSEQVDRVAALEPALEEVLESGQRGETAREVAARLARAHEVVEEAREAEDRAMGRPDLAVARRSARRVRALAPLQGAAERTLADLEEGRAATPFEAVAGAERLAAEIDSVVASRDGRHASEPPAPPPEVAERLGEASAAARDAARAALHGRAESARRALGAARAALDGARAAASGAAASGAPAGARSALDVSAQERTGALLGTARGLVGDQVPEAARALDRGGRTSAEAADLLRRSDPAGAAEPQEATARALGDASRAIADRLERLRREDATRQEQTARSAGALAPRTARVDAAATAALRAARDGRARADPGGPFDVLAGRDHLERSLQRAAANLFTRRERIERDRTVAEGLERAGEELEGAVAALHESRELLDRNAAGAESAARLLDAARRFVAHQRAVGQAAVEISGQTEVVHPPIREALEIASRLDTGLPEVADAPVEGDQRGEAMGTGFVAPTPQVTALMVAGSKAGEDAREVLASAEALLEDAGGPARGSSEGPGEGPGQGQGPGEHEGAGQGQGGAPALGAAETARSGGGSSRGGSAARNDPAEGGPLAVRADGGAPADSRLPSGGASEGRAREERALGMGVWFARLPPELRGAIRAAARSPPPRSYEERLRRYFESLE